MAFSVSKSAYLLIQLGQNAQPVLLFFIVLCDQVLPDGPDMLLSFLLLSFFFSLQLVTLALPTFLLSTYVSPYLFFLFLSILPSIFKYVQQLLRPSAFLFLLSLCPIVWVFSILEENYELRLCFIIYLCFHQYFSACL